MQCVGPIDHYIQCSIQLADGRAMAAYIRGGAFVMEFR